MNEPNPVEYRKLYESPTTEAVVLKLDGCILVASVEQYEPIEW
jgi:hypothetical protein